MEFCQKALGTFSLIFIFIKPIFKMMYQIEVQTTMSRKSILKRELISANNANRLTRFIFRMPHFEETSHDEIL